MRTVRCLHLKRVKFGMFVLLVIKHVLIKFNDQVYQFRIIEAQYTETLFLEFLFEGIFISIHKLIFQIMFFENIIFCNRWCTSVIITYMLTLQS